MPSTLPPLHDLPEPTRKAAKTYTDAVALLVRLEADLGAVCGTNRQHDAEHADQQVMLAALDKGEDPALIGTPNEAARRASEVYGRKAVEAQRTRVGELEHALGLLFLDHREAAIALVEGTLDPAADAYRDSIEALFAARTAQRIALGRRAWATRISTRDPVPHVGAVDDGGTGPSFRTVGEGGITADALRAGLLADAAQGDRDRAAEQLRARRQIIDDAEDAKTAAAAAIRRTREAAEVAALRAASEQPPPIAA